MNIDGINFKSLSSAYIRSGEVALQAHSQNELAKEEQEGAKMLEFGSNGVGVRVVFEDGHSDQLIKLSLSEDNFERLRNKFKDEGNYFQREDGSIRLNADAQNFVSSWFSDMAYGLNWLQADADKDGIIAGSELENAYLHTTEIGIEGRNVHFSYAGKMRADSTMLNEIDIEAGLNDRLNSDKNLDGQVDYSELYDTNDLRTFARVADELDVASRAFNASKKKKAKDLLTKVLEGGLSALTQQELAQFRVQHPSQYEKLASQNDLRQNLSQDFSRQFSNYDFRIIDFKI
ncbi:hypothetical protein [Campylobacter sp.]|uniref:hypothetical protein n=1 Tax=Campylobacter sp. TaxID=205 RepID=UPI0026DD0398|nr:hypothetical protein [Campylobacter sp.]MDO4674043.1 hypothetical protein [Campylobacter sp.]